MSNLWFWWLFPVLKHYFTEVKICRVSLDALVQLFPDITAALDLQVMLLVGSSGSAISCASRIFGPIWHPLKGYDVVYWIEWEFCLWQYLTVLFNAEFDPLLRNNRDSIINLNTSLWAQSNSSSLPVMIKHSRINTFNIFFSKNSFTVGIIASGETGCYLLSSAGKTPATCKQLLVKSLKKLSFVSNGN